MRIELPLPSWADTPARAEDDAHTLTVAGLAVEWTPWQWEGEPAPVLRTDVGAEAPVPLTLTL